MICNGIPKYFKSRFLFSRQSGSTGSYLKYFLQLDYPRFQTSFSQKGRCYLSFVLFLALNNQLRSYGCISGIYICLLSKLHFL